MGSGYKVFTAGAVLTASDLNNFCQEQSVMYFATTAARDSAITSPEDGMVAYIGSNDANEGLYTYNGTSWRKGPGWNAPWGLMSSTATTTSSSIGGTETVAMTGTAFTAVANRNYRFTFTGTYVGTVANDLFQYQFRATNAAGTSYLAGRISIPGTPFQHTLTASAIFSPSAGSFTPVLTLQGVSPNFSGTISLPVQNKMIIEDVGPSGAPA